MRIITEIDNLKDYSMQGNDEGMSRSSMNISRRQVLRGAALAVGGTVLVGCVPVGSALDPHDIRTSEALDTPTKAEKPEFTATVATEVGPH